MQAIENALISFFERVVQQDSAIIDELSRESDFQVQQGRWTFTLPALHAYLQKNIKAFSSIDYSQFRSAIFSSNINQIIQLKDAKIIIAINRGKVNLSEYALVWKEPDP